MMKYLISKVNRKVKVVMMTMMISQYKYRQKYKNLLGNESSNCLLCFYCYEEVKEDYLLKKHAYDFEIDETKRQIIGDSLEEVLYRKQSKFQPYVNITIETIANTN